MIFAFFIGDNRHTPYVLEKERWEEKERHEEDGEHVLGGVLNILQVPAVSTIEMTTISSEAYREKQDTFSLLMFLAHFSLM